MPTFATQCHRAGLSRKDAITFFKISPKTFHNWNNKGAPHHVTAALELITGTLDRHGFNGWTIRRGKLYCPAGNGYSPREIEMIPLHLVELAMLRTTNDQYRRQFRAPFTITTRPAANDEKRPERTPAFTDGIIYLPNLDDAKNKQTKQPPPPPTPPE